jgi:hypothetical protein
MTSRRDFLRNVGLSAIGFGAVGAAAVGRPRTTSRSEAIWGDYPVHARASQVPEHLRAQSVLEIFLYGGICPWETFYTVDEPDYGKADGQMWWTFQDGPESVQSIYRKCLGDSAPPIVKDFAKDQNGTMVKLGPFVDALRQRKDITDRLRLHVISHNLRVHEIAIPLALTGYRLALPRLAGLGTSVQRYFLPRENAREPLSYVIVPYHRLLTPIFAHASAVGGHPAYARPLTLQATGTHSFTDALQRRTIGDQPELSDALFEHAIEQFGSRLERDGTAARSKVWDEYIYAAGKVRDSNALTGVFTPTLATQLDGETCGEHSDLSVTAMQLRLAAHLLGRRGSPTRHVSVIDTALFQDISRVGYDTHQRHTYDSGRNLTYFFKQLVSFINKPGENDPTKIDLNRTMVVLNTEFGRTPEKQGTDGREHYPNAYVTAMFGGPIGPKQRGIVGAIDHRAQAVDALSPAETRAATLAALGIWPFSSEGYSVSDMHGVNSTDEAAERVKERVLGIT